MYNILVTGVGAIIGYGIINSLRQSRFPVNIIGIDIFDDAIGREWCDFFIKGVPAREENFNEFLMKTIIDNNVDLVIPGIEQDLFRIAEDFDYFKTINTRFAINEPRLINIFNDKWETNTFFSTAGIDLIPSFIEGDFKKIQKSVGVPMLLKPRRSYASKGIYEISCEDDFLYWKQKLGNNFMVQKIMGDRDSEYTVAVFGLGDGNYSNIIALKRKLGPDGATAKAELVIDNKLIEYIDSIVNFSKPIGPTNIQVIKDNNKYFLLEINPRISSSTSIRQLFGVNEAEMCIEFFLENKIPQQRILKSGKVRRYIKDYVTYDSNNF